MSYNGWKNYETWNVILWIGNDEGLYNFARECKTYSRFCEGLKETSEGSPIAYQTPDGVSWNDSSLDRNAIDEYFQEL